MPIAWRDSAGTKVHRGRDAMLALIGLIRIRANALAGRYHLREGTRLQPARADGEPQRGQ